jgi:predicted AlkP superfamily phosphohydrolase/phosphomutase
MRADGAGRKVLLLEFNEITWTIIDPLIARGELPNFARLRREGTWASPEALERPPHLDPWVTWVTLHTGVDRDVHGATVLEQDSGTITAKRTWDYAADAGKSVGVFGSIGAYPPRPVNGFMVPGPFAPGSETYPESLRPIQDLNRRYTQVHNKIASQSSVLEMLREGAAIFRLGLRPETVARVLRQLATERLQPHSKWKRVTLQPLINYDIFAHAYRKVRPDYATWHTNHAAHFMHHYWRAMDDSQFPAPASAEEKAHYGDAVRYGYKICDELLGRFMELVDDKTVLVLASSMGQQPYVNERYQDGKLPVRFKDVRAVLEIVGAKGVTEVVPTMVPQWNVRIPNDAERARVRDLLRAARCEGGAYEAAMWIDEVGADLTLSPYGIASRDKPIRYTFPDSPNARPQGYTLEELFVCDAPTPKEGMHHPRGLVIFHGAQIPAGLELANVSPLDIAPTILHLLGVPIPAVMPGRVLPEVAGSLPPPADRATARPIAERAPVGAPAQI